MKKLVLAVMVGGLGLATGCTEPCRELDAQCDSCPDADRRQACEQVANANVGQACIVATDVYVECQQSPVE